MILRGIQPLVVWTMLLLAAFAPSASNAAGAPDGDTLRVLFSSDVFGTVNRADAIASSKAWIESVGRRRGLRLVVEVKSYDSVDHLRTLVRQDAADLFILNSTHLLDLAADQARLDALFVPERDGFVLEEYLLLSRRDRSLDLSDLRGRRVLFLKTVGANLARPWTASLLREEGLGSLETFLPSAEDELKASSAILPVFFGQAEACVVDASSFGVMQELNPQIGTALEARRSSPPYLETVICVRRSYQGHRTDLVEGLAELQGEAAGRQILMVFKIERLVPFADSQLQSVRALRAAPRPGAEAELQ